MGSHRINLPVQSIAVRSVLAGLLIGAGLIGTCLLAGCSRKTDAATGQPIQTASGLVCTNPKWNLGEVLVKGDTVPFDHVFVLENHSDKEIKLHEVRSDCGCLVAKDYNKTLPPGGRSEVKVTISVFGPPGPFTKSLLVTEESNSKEAIPLSVFGSRAISSLLSSSPAVIHFGELTPGQAKIKQVFISRYDGSSVNFQELQAKDSCLSLAGKPVDSVRTSPMKMQIKCIELPIQLQLTSQPLGAFKSLITIKTGSTDKSTSTLEIPVEATIVEQPSALVRSIFVERLERGASVERPLVDGADQAAPLKILSVSFEGDNSLQVELINKPSEKSDEGKPTKHPMVRITRPRDSAAEGLIRGSLNLQTGDSTDKTAVSISAFLPK